MATGQLKVQVHTGSDAIPLENASVLIKDAYGRIIYDLTTDGSGNTIPVQLFAPDKYHTLDPNDPGPYYGVYDVEIRNGNNFITAISKGVQIFDGVEAVLPVYLQPNPTPEQEVIQIHYIPTNNLHSPEPRFQPGPYSYYGEGM